MPLATHRSYFKHHDSLTLLPTSKEDDDAGSSRTIRRESNLTASSASAVLSSHPRTAGSRSVSFGSVEVTSFPIVLSDNPGGKTGGPSIGLGPKPVSMSPATFDLDIYEAGRAGRRRKPDAMLAPPSTRYVGICRVVDDSNFLLSLLLYHLILLIYTLLPSFSLYLLTPSTNQDWVKEAGHTTNEIRQSTKEINLIKKQRAISRKSKGFIILHDFRDLLRRPLAKAKPSCLRGCSIRVAKETDDEEITPKALDSPSADSIRSKTFSSRFSRPLRAPST